MFADVWSYVGVPSFPHILTQFGEKWKENPKEMYKASENIMKDLIEATRVSPNLIFSIIYNNLYYQIRWQ